MEETPTPKKGKVLKWTGIVLGVFVLLAIISAVGSKSSGTNVAASPSVSGICATDPQAIKKEAFVPDYKQLKKDPSASSGTMATFTGQIVEIQQNGNEGIMRLSVTKESYGWSLNDIVFVTYHQATDAVDGDVVTVTGKLTGSQTYTSQANFQITVPSIDVCTIDAQAKTAPPPPAPQITPETPKPKSAKLPSTSAPQAPPAQPMYTTPSGAVVNPSGNVVSSPPPPPASWHTAYTYSSSATIHTPPFSLQGQQQKIDYSCSVLDSGNKYGGTFNGIIDSTADYHSDVFAWTVTCPTSNSTYEYTLSPGQYYLDLGATNASYNVTIQDYY